MNEMLHLRENNEVSEQFFKDNGEKFSRHCNIVLTLMYKGMKLTARQLEREYNIDGRRLRDIYANRKECKKSWRVVDGKEIEMEYWLDVPMPPTKKELQDFFTSYQNETPVIDINRRHYTQQNLFNE